MSLYQDIRGALQARLATVSGIPAIAYEALPFKPVRGTPFVACVVAPVSADQATLGDGHVVLHRGTFEVSVVYPSNKGTGDAEAMADAIKAEFRGGTVLTRNTTQVIIAGAKRSLALIEADWLRIPVSVAWHLHSTD